MAGIPDETMAFERRLREARDTLGSPGTRPDPGPPSGLPSGTSANGPETFLCGEGEAAEGQVRAVVVTGGRVRSLELDPRVLRLPHHELAVHVADALNAALDALREHASAEVADGVPDPAAMLDRLREVQNEGLRQLVVMTRGVNDALAGIRDRAHVSGEAGAHGWDELLHQVQGMLAPVPDDGAPATAVGTAADGRVRVVASGAGRIDDVSLEPAVLRLASHELAGHLADAADDALAGAYSETPGRAAGIPADELRERVRRLQDQRMEQMRAMTRSLTALMNSIQKR